MMNVRLGLLGGVSLAAFVAHAVLSWPLAASLRGGQSTPVYGSIAWAQGWFTQDRDFVLAYCLPLVVQTVCAVMAASLVLRRPVEQLPSGRVLLGWSVLFALASFGAASVLQRDAWLSIAWGRMMLRGEDPYLAAFTPADAAGLPLDGDVLEMTYGPAWAGLTALIAVVTGGAGAAGWWLQKLVLLGAWILILWCVRALARSLGPRRECLAIIVTGWLPVGVHSSVAEQHNDVVMVALMLVALLARQSWAGPLAMAGSVLTKYSTAVLAPVALLYEWRTSRAGLLRRIWPAAVLLALGAVFVLSGGRLDEAAGMRTWHFLEPADPLRLLGVPDALAFWSMRLVFGLVALWAMVRLWRFPSTTELLATALAVMSFVAFTLVGHAWPWFFVWLVPLAALVPDRPLSVFVLACAAVSPFTISFWARVTEAQEARMVAGSVMYLAGAAALTVWSLWRGRKVASAAPPAAA